MHTGALQVLEEALRVYFNAHTDGNIPTGLHKRVIQEVEECLLQQTLAFTRNNQVRAAHILGISRNTLRKKLAEIGAER
ncbi:MAG: Fis family transcriptional regulator [Holosporales bacterium]|nr:Fis family transcriptional regulator [Holosporales bacterium]